MRNLSGLAILDAYGPLVLAALARAGVTEKVAVHRVIAVIAEARTMEGFRGMTWGELQAIVAEAYATSEREYHLWEQRARKHVEYALLESVPVMCDRARYAVADETLYELAEQREVDPSGDPSRGGPVRHESGRWIW